MVQTHVDIIDRLWEHGHSAYTVGGGVRDLLLGLDPHDFDVATSATPSALTEIFHDCKVNLVGASFGVVLVNGIEVATFRQDVHGQRFDARSCQPVYVVDLHEDLKRRDLTVNALALCRRTGEIIDLFGGRSDLHNRVIRFVGSPQDRISEDPARIVRACRFLALLEGRFDSASLAAMMENAELVRDYVAPERLRLEILKAMSLPTPSLFWSALHLVGALQYVLPELENCQNTDHGRFHKENIWEHLMVAGDHVSPKYPLVRLAAFLHDTGKPLAWTRNNDGSFVDHELIGGDLMVHRLGQLKFANQEVVTITRLIYTHMRPASDLSPKSARRLLKYLGDQGVSLWDFLRHRSADKAANMGKTPYTLVNLLAIARSIVRSGFSSNQEFTTKDLALTGGMMMERFGLSPGPIIGRVQKHLLNLVVDNGLEFNQVEWLAEQAADWLSGNR